MKHAAPMPTLRRILFIEELSSLIGKSATTIRTCATNAKYAHLIPRPFKLPHSRRLAWYEDDVAQWIRSATPVGLPPVKRKRGRPTKARATGACASTASEIAIGPGRTPPII